MNFSQLLIGLGAGSHHGGGHHSFSHTGGMWHHGHNMWPRFVYVESPTQCPAGYVLHVIYNESVEMTYAEWRLAGSPGPYRFVCRPGGFGESEAGVGQDMVSPRFGPVWPVGRPSYFLGALGDNVEAGDYHIVGTGVVLRKAPSGDSEVLGTFQNGENVYLFGAVAVDDQHIISSTGAISPNDGNSPGIEYARAGSQLFGPGFVALRFVAPGKGTSVKPVETQPVDTTPKPAPAVAVSAATTYAPMILAGSLLALGVAGIYLYNHHKGF